MIVILPVCLCLLQIAKKKDKVMAITPMMVDLSMVQATTLIMVILNHNIDFIFILMLATTFPGTPGHQPHHPHQHR